ncbi:MAG: hypothetical protein K2K36_00880, partial [Muribaculaceae bacterium]|nr:hypothetical protein [Muribaculaceae bacterium]
SSVTAIRTRRPVVTKNTTLLRVSHHNGSKVIHTFAYFQTFSQKNIFLPLPYSQICHHLSAHAADSIPAAKEDYFSFLNL